MSLIPLIQGTLHSLLKLGDLTNTGNLKQLLREHLATAYPLAEAYQKSYTDTLETIHAAVSPGWKDWLGARRKQQFMAQVAHYYLVDFAQVKGWSPAGVELITFKNTAAPQYQALLKESQSLFRSAALPAFTEDELAGIIAVKGLPSVTQLVLERLRSFQIRVPEAEALAFLQHQELLGKGIEFFLRHHPEVAANLQDLQTTGLWDTVQNMEKELVTLKQAGVREQIQVEDEFKAYDTQTFKRVGQAVVLLRKRAVKPTEACQAWLMAGSAVFTLGEMGQARHLLEEALQLAQNEAEAALVHFNLFQVYLREDTVAYKAVAFHHLQTAMTLEAQYRFYDARKYQLQRLLGAGGMGCAFVGQELVFQREVVIKWFWQKFTTDQEVQQVFQEASLMWRIPREFVPAPLDVSLHGDSACLITEYLPEAIDGESWLGLHGPLTVKEAMSVALQLARGLQAAHRQGVWHLDLKPANVLLYREQSALLAKIIDFGLSRLAQPLMSQVRRSQKQSSQLGFRLAGTWDYAAPEQRGIKKYGPVSAKSDVYGLGKTLMRLCTGKAPQDCRERDLPMELREVLFDCIEDNPAQRLDSTAVIERLQGVTQQRDEEARQQQLREQREREETEQKRQAEMAKQREEEARQLQEQREREAAEERQRQAEMAKQLEEEARQQQLREQQEREETEQKRQAEMAKQREREEVEQKRQAEESHNHILWVDDRPNNNVYERQAFEKIGIRFTLALSTNEALEILKKTPFAVVISDMARREGSREGYMLLDTMRKQGYQTPVFFYAGSTRPEHKRETLEHGGQGCTSNSEVLFEMVTKVLNKDTRPQQVNHPPIIQQLQKSLGQELPLLGIVKVDSKGYQLNANQQVVRLGLYQMGLTEIPREVWQLTQLQWLWLMDNQLTQLPPEIGQLTQLQGLCVSNNQLTQLPPEIGQLTQLQWLDLEGNQLTQLPSEIGLLTPLRELQLWHNRLTQLPPEIGQLTQLQVLVLEENQLTQLPPEIGQLTQLQGLWLKANQLTQLPFEIGQLTQLRELGLYNNPLQVPPPEVIQQGTQAVIEYLQEKCQAEIAQQREAAARQQQLREQQERDEAERQRQAKEAELQPQLQEQRERDEAERQRQEEATRQQQWREQQERDEAERQRLEEATRQQQLREQQERDEAERQRQEEVTRQQQWREQQERDEAERQRREKVAPQKQVDDLTIIQRLQDSLGQELPLLGLVKVDSKGYQVNAQQQVVSLALCQMNLTEIPKTVWQLTQLQFLGLRGNQLTQLPKELGRLTQLRKLQLEKNQLTQLPAEIGQLTQLQELQLTTNQLTQLPPKIRQLTQLQRLSLWGNQLTQLLKEIGLLRQLQILDVGNNKLTRLPKEIGLLTQLQKLGVGNNKLIQLPAEIGQLTQLRELQLTTNQLTELPAEIGLLTQLQELYLDNNPLQVPPPKVIRQGTQAVIKYFQKKWWWW